MFTNLFNNKKLLILFGLFLGILVVVLGIILFYSRDKEEVKEVSDTGVLQSIDQADIIENQEQLEDFENKWGDFTKDKTGDIGAYLTYAQNGGARYDCEAPIMTVGEETLYGCDLNVQFVMRDFESYVSGKFDSIEDESLKRMIDEVVIQSGILQKGNGLGIIELDNSFYNSPTKDMAKRFGKVKNVRESLKENYIKRLDYEAISIYFHNQEPPNEISLEEAKRVAKTKMDVLYGRLKNGEITMEEAGNEIKADNITGDTTGVSLSKLDPIYEQNSYIKAIGHEYGTRMFKDESGDEEVINLREGEISDILLLKDYKITSEELIHTSSGDDYPMVDSCYVIIQMNSIHDGKNGVSVAETIEGIDEKILTEFRNKLIIKSSL